MTTTQISSSRLESLVTDNSLSFTVQASTGGNFVVSDLQTVTIVDNPELDITGSSLVHVHEEAEREFSGEIVTFEPDSNERLKSLTASIEPQQDLHGYDRPWAPGAGKNLVEIADGSTTTTITAAIIELEAGTYTFSVYGKREDGAQWRVLVSQINGTAIEAGVASSGTTLQRNYATFTLTETTSVRLQLQFLSSYDTLQYERGQLERGSTATAWAPYSNVCPITGHDTVDVIINGVNVWDEEWENGGIRSSDGTNSTDANRIRAKNLIPIVGTTYYVKAPSNLTAFYYDMNKDFMESKPMGSNITFIPINGAKYMRFTVGSSSNPVTTYNNDISINYPSTDTDYHAYVGTTHTTSLGQTVYGGSLDVGSGVLTVTAAYLKLNTSTLGGSDSWPSWVNCGIRELVGGGLNSIIRGALSSIAGTVYANTANTNDLLFLSASEVGKTKAELIAMAIDVDFFIPLAEEYTIELTPQQVELLTGANNVWADTGSVDVKLTETTKDEDQLQTNNLSLEFTSNRLCDLIVIVTSQGAVGQFPAGIRRQTAGDTIHSTVYSPEWTEDNDVFTASINLPTGLDFWDLGRYTVSVVAIDRETGLRSEEASASFAVEWAKQAVDIRPTTTYALSTDTVVDEDKTYYTYDSTTESYLPVDDPVGDEDPSAEGWYEATVTNYITLTPIDEIDDTGYHRQAVQIALIPPPGSEETDLYDIYRLTGDGAVLIGESFPLTCMTTDEYAPFGEDMTLNYRVALRTIDGDISFADFEYVQDSSHLRFDWATGFVEYPYNLSIGDAYKKDVEFRSHLDGGIDGYWNQNIERQAKLSTDLIWIEQQDVIDKTRELARYAGPVYVRTPEGTAYEADVQVTDMSGTDNIIMAVAIDATEVDVTAEFLLPTPYRKEEESE